MRASPKASALDRAMLAKPPSAVCRAGRGTRAVVSRGNRAVAAASRPGGARCELQGVWKTFADVAGKTEEVIGNKGDVMFAFVEMSCASEDARCAHAVVMFTDVVATVTQRDGMSPPGRVMSTKEEAM